MAEDKKSFLVYANLLETLEYQTDEVTGKLFKHILLYVNDRNPETKDPLINALFNPIKQRLKFDLNKWGDKKEGYSKAGKLSSLSKNNHKDLYNKVKSDELELDEALEIAKTRKDNKTANPVLKTSKEPKVKKDTTERETKFKEFYNLYDKKRAPDLTKKRFLALTDKEVEAIFETVKGYIASTPEKKYRKDPASYLHNKLWKDEIITEETNLINESITVEKVIALFDETDFPHTIKQYKTDKPSLKIRLNEFLEKNYNTTDFKRSTIEKALKWFVSSLEYSRPKIVIKETESPWCNNNN